MRKYLFSIIVIMTGTINASAAEIKVLSTTAIKETLTELVPQFEKSSGHKLNITWSSSSIIQKQIPEGGKFDLVITTAPDIAKFMMAQSVVEGSRTDFGRTGVAIAVKEGTPKLDVSTAEKVKKAILDAKSIVYSTGPSGLYVERMIGDMGILDQVKPKMKQNPPGVRVASFLVKGDAELEPVVI